MKILVTGAAGFIGSHLAENLVQEGHNVIGIDNFSSYYNPELKKYNALQAQEKGVVFCELDLVSNNLEEVIRDVECVVHLAAQPGLASHVRYEDYKMNNVDATQKLLDSFVGSETLKCFVYISTSSVYGKEVGGDETVKLTPASDYGKAKLEAETLSFKYYKEKDIPVTALRLFSVIGPRERPEKLYSKLIRNILNNESFTLFEGSEKHIRSYTYVEDIVEGIKLALFNHKKSVGEIFNIGGTEQTTTKEGIDLVQELIGKKANIELVPSRVGDQLYTNANIEKAKHILGYEPKTSFREAIQKQIEWFKNEIHGKF